MVVVNVWCNYERLSTHRTFVILLCHFRIVPFSSNCMSGITPFSFYLFPILFVICGVVDFVASEFILSMLIIMTLVSLGLR